MNCPHCGKPIETQQHRAAVSRWSQMTKEEKSAEMSRIRRNGIKKPKVNDCARTPKLTHRHHENQ